MASAGVGSENTLSDVTGVVAVIVAYLREYVGILREPWAEVREAATVYEFVLSFAAVPILLLSIDATVHSQHWALPLMADSITDPETAALAFTSSFVHAGSTHLWGNVGGYLLIMSALYPLAVLSGKKRHLAGVSVFNLLAVPLVTGQLSLLLPGTGSTLGFSGVNAAFLGSLILFVFFAWDTESGEIHPIWAVGPASASLALVLAVAPLTFPYMLPPSEYTVGFGVLGGLLGVAFFHRNGCSALRQFWSRKSSVLYWGGGVLVVGFARLLVFIPENANLLSHGGGFYVGFFGLFALVVGRESRKRAGTTRVSRIRSTSADAE